MLLTLLPGGPAHACAALRAAHGLAANETARLSAFRAALSTPPLSDTLAYAMASASLSYDASFAARHGCCADDERGVAAACARTRRAAHGGRDHGLCCPGERCAQSPAGWSGTL